MHWLGEPPSGAVSQPLQLVLDRAIEQGAPRPGGLVFLDPKQKWRDTLCRLSLAERRGCIAVALDDHDLAHAVRWSIGGGVLLPVSLTRVAAACYAAHEACSIASWIGDPAVVAEMRLRADAVRLSLQPTEVWDVMVGQRGCLEILTDLALSLGQPALIESGPCLTLTGSTPAAVEAAWKNLGGRPLWAADRTFLSIQGGDFEDNSNNQGADGTGHGWPVAQWPSGKLVARWRVEPHDLMRPWRLETSDGNTLSVEPVSTRLDMAEATAPILRVGGNVAFDLDREGSPGAIAVEALAREADRSGRTLWIPGVSRHAATVIRRWGVAVWVDGPVLLVDYST